MRKETSLLHPSLLGHLLDTKTKTSLKKIGGIDYYFYQIASSCSFLISQFKDELKYFTTPRFVFGAIFLSTGLMIVNWQKYDTFPTTCVAVYQIVVFSSVITSNQPTLLYTYNVTVVYFSCQLHLCFRLFSSFV